MAATQQQATASQLVAPTLEAWELFFPGEGFDDSDRRVILIRDLVLFLSSELGWTHLQGALRFGDEYVLDLQYERLKADCKLGDLAAAMEWQPKEALACLGAAVHQVRRSGCLPCTPAFESGRPRGGRTCHVRGR